jgi:hypothetical protein
MGELRDRTTFRINHLKGMGLTVITKRECEFKKDVKVDPELELFTKDYMLTEPLNPNMWILPRFILG